MHEQPILKIRPSGKWVTLNLGDVWSYRELLYFLTWRDIKVRYKQTLLGAAWAIIQPLSAMLIFTLFFGKIAGLPSDGIPYPVFAYAGLLPWTFFSNAVTNGSNSLIGSANLITKIYFPRMIVPCSAVVAALIDLAIAFTVLIGLIIYYGIAPTWKILMLPLLITLLTLLAVGVGMWMSALNVKYRDIRYTLPVLIQLGLFVTPVIYPLSMVPERWRWLMAINPLTGIVEGFRTSLLGRGEFNWMALGVSTITTLVLLTYSAYMFRRMERVFADIV